jgi:type III pantothenate kinase
MAPEGAAAPPVSPPSGAAEATARGAPRDMQRLMLLAIDVGNTNTVLGLYSGDDLLHHFRIESGRGRTADEYAALMRMMLDLRKLLAMPRELRMIIKLLKLLVNSLCLTLLKYVSNKELIEPLAN